MPNFFLMIIFNLSTARALSIDFFETINEDISNENKVIKVLESYLQYCSSF